MFPSLSGLKDHGLKWLKPRCVCADSYGDSGQQRRDDVVILENEHVIFAKLMLLCKVKIIDEWHELCYVQLYKPVNDNALNHPVFQEPYVELCEQYSLYPFLCG